MSHEFASNSVYKANPSFASSSSSKYNHPKFSSSNVRYFQNPSDNFVPSQQIDTASKPYHTQRFDPVSTNKFRYVTPLPPTTTNVPTSTILQTSKASNNDNFEESASEGLKLLNDLVKIISEVSGTAADSDPEEVRAIKTIFSDIIDEVIRVVESSFDPSSSSDEKDAFILSQNAIKSAVSNAETQSVILSILEPYIVSLREFISKGLRGSLI